MYMDATGHEAVYKAPFPDIDAVCRVERNAAYRRAADGKLERLT
jgi:hypothetical protein